VAVAADKHNAKLGIRCPVCGRGTLRVYYTRRRRRVIVRCRQCEQCGHRVFTEERRVF